MPGNPPSLFSLLFTICSFVYLLTLVKSLITIVLLFCSPTFLRYLHVEFSTLNSNRDLLYSFRLYVSWSHLEVLSPFPFTFPEIFLSIFSKLTFLSVHLRKRKGIDGLSGRGSEMMYYNLILDEEKRSGPLVGWSGPLTQNTRRSFNLNQNR